MISVVVTTFENPKALDLVLAGLSRQRTGDFEVLVADDGSTETTREVVERWKRDLVRPRRFVHVWQADRGFRAGAARNRAVLASEGEAILFLDGDCVPHPHWAYDLARALAPGRFVQGHRVLFGPALSKRVRREDVETGRIFSPGFLLRAALAREASNLHNALRLPFGPLRHRGDVARGIRTANLAVRREDLYRVNGFDESYEGWGREDADLAVRLAGAGVSRYDARFSAIVCHLYHPPKSREALASNDARLRKARREADEGRVRARRGLMRGADPGPSPRPPSGSPPGTAAA